MKTQERHPLPPTSNQIIKIINQQIKKYKYNKIYLVTEDLKNLSILKKYYINFSIITLLDLTKLISFKNL